MARHRSGTVSTCVGVHRTDEYSSSKRRKEHCWQHGLRPWARAVQLGRERSGDYVAQRRSRIQRILVWTHTRASGCCPHFASIILEPDAVQAIHSICCVGPPHWKEQCWVGFLPDLETFGKKCCCKVPHVLLLLTKAATRVAASYPPQLCEEHADLLLNAMTDRVASLNVLESNTYKGQAWTKSASIKRICVSAAQIKERRQGSRKRSPSWWLTAAKPDFVLGSRLGINWTPVVGLHRHCARQRHTCDQTHAFVWASRFPGSTVRACRKGSKSNSKKVRFGTNRNAQVVLWAAQRRSSGYPLWSDSW